jgi:cation:H+ antiporter
MMIGGLALLGFASDWFVVGSARLASLARIPPVIVGAVVIGFGTSAPELLVSLLASLEGDAPLAVGNIIGSNLANQTLVLGTAAMAGTIVVSSSTIRREAPVSASAVCLFGICVLFGIGPVAGAVLSVAMVGATVIIVRAARASRAADELELIEEVAQFEAPVPQSVSSTVLLAGVGLVGTLAGAQLVVMSAVDIAERAGLSQGFIGLTLVAVGTSLPELVTSVQAVRRGEDELIVGNVLGSNLFNSLGAGAIIAFASGGFDPGTDLLWGVGLMVVVTIAATVFMASRRRFTRVEGVVLLVGYAATVPLLAGG